MPVQTATRRTLAAALAGVALLISACDSRPQPRIRTAQPAQESSRAFGDYEVHYNALRTDSLTPEVARSYGIQRSANKVMVTVSVLRREGPGASARPVDAAAEAQAYNLTGQLKDLQLRRVSEGDAIYHIGEVSISGSEILVFEISVTPAGEQAPLSVKFQREFEST